ncbi:hypothetical protein QCA50_006708 [Cerrena zonata]|uniref:Uncharacterized protein n=1 Tax=Cerrena zonata TaxID=2478898 RepID=A0AAW0GIJ9_9APHY
MQQRNEQVLVTTSTCRVNTAQPQALTLNPTVTISITTMMRPDVSTRRPMTGLTAVCSSSPYFLQLSSTPNSDLLATTLFCCLSPPM